MKNAFWLILMISASFVCGYGASILSQKSDFKKDGNTISQEMAIVGKANVEVLSQSAILLNILSDDDHSDAKARQEAMQYCINSGDNAMQILKDVGYFEVADEGIIGFFRKARTNTKLYIIKKDGPLSDP